MFGFLSQIPSFLGKGLGYAGQGLKAAGSGLGKLPQRLGMADDPSGMMRTPDFVSTGGRAMPDFKPPIQSGGLTDLLYRGPSGGDVNLAPRPSADWNPMREASAAPAALPMRNIGAREALTNIARAENPPLEQAPQYRDPIREARDEFVNDRLQNRARWKQMLIPALLGAASQGESGNVGRMLGGALGGFGMGAFAPEQALQGEYEMRQGGRDREELQREEDWRKAQAALGNMKEQRENERRRIEQQGRLAQDELTFKQQAEAAKAQREEAAQRERQRANEIAANRPTAINAPAYVVGGEIKQNPYFTPRQNTAIRPLGENVPGYLDPTNTYQPNPGYRPKPEREGPPQGATQSAAALDKMRREAMQRWDEAKAMPAGPDKEMALADAQSALAQFNEAVKQLGENYGDYYETGSGKGGWGYYKPRKRSQSASPASGGGSMGAAAGGRRNVNDLLKLLK